MAPSHSLLHTCHHSLGSCDLPLGMQSGTCRQHSSSNWACATCMQAAYHVTYAQGNTWCLATCAWLEGVTCPLPHPRHSHEEGCKHSPHQLLQSLTSPAWRWLLEHWLQATLAAVVATMAPVLGYAGDKACKASLSDEQVTRAR